MSQFLFVTDLDNTFVGDDAALEELSQLLDEHRRQHGSKIAYATGRSLALYVELKNEKNLLNPDVLVCAVGTEIYYSLIKAPDTAWKEKLSLNWDRARAIAIAAEFPDLVPQPSTEQTPFKVSYWVEEEPAANILPKLETSLAAQNIDARVVYSSGRDLDILPRHGNKGAAMRFLREKFHIPADRTVVCGDSGNDLSLFEYREERGIIVGNARKELLEWHQANPYEHHYVATAACSAGILEGMRHFGFLP